MAKFPMEHIVEAAAFRGGKCPSSEFFAIRQSITDEGAIAVIPSKSNAKVQIPHDPNLYAMRNLVERFFCRMKDMRRLTTRYEKLKRNFLSMLHIFAIRGWLN